MGVISLNVGMATNETPAETKVSDRGMVTIPAEIRRRLDIEPGDKLRWETDESGDLTVTVVRQRYGAFDDDDLKAPMGGDGLETHDLAGHEDDPAFTEDS
jgi:AbrB family looped-hinge helix DNA binding protein